ncbi:hypothetical protein AVO45_10465 [Ruegeria marisrubri]|uniref:6-phosphogluconolactonase n=1 Tax=Ruegeria marisrubri TaxID=1685379 RepID=A0A0X3TR25_9RHOB|nr:6-phosphogluconolactonase [Ruegeria marisrubri]KUJ76906.1 hypothetical protein AVO45_10465 [Ruegeria marisrubri]
MHEFIEYSDPAQQAAELASVVAKQLSDTLAHQEKATLAVPGGTTPARFLAELSNAALEWNRVSVLLSDERFVPETEPRSNTRLLREQFVRNAAAEATIVPLYAAGATPESVLEQLSAGVRKVSLIDVCVLGMGADMHVASLFPGGDNLAKALDVAGPDVLIPMRASGAEEPRVSLTASALTGATHLHLLIKGPEKLAALRHAESEGSAMQAPVRIVLGRRNLTVHYTNGGE